MHTGPVPLDTGTPPVRIPLRRGLPGRAWATGVGNGGPSWAANGTSCGAVPAPVGYDLLGNVKVLLWYVREVTRYLPPGLERSLGEDAIVVYDRDLGTGQDRDPTAQVATAILHLERLNAALQEAAAAAEAAQSAISGQGYSPAHARPAVDQAADRSIQERVVAPVTTTTVRRGSTPNLDDRPPEPLIKSSPARVIECRPGPALTRRRI